MVLIADGREKRNIIKKYPHTKPYLKRKGNLYIAEENNTLIGFAFVQKRSIVNEPNKFENLILVIEVFDEGKRNKGFATKIINLIKEDAKQNNIYQLIAYYQKENMSSHKLWVKNNFCITHLSTKDKKDFGCVATYKI